MWIAASEQQQKKNLVGKKKLKLADEQIRTLGHVRSAETALNKMRIYAESTRKHTFHNHHQPFRRTVIIFWARTPPAIISQSRWLFIEFSTFSRSCSNLISFPSYSSCVFLMFLNRLSFSVFPKFKTVKDISTLLQKYINFHVIENFYLKNRFWLWGVTITICCYNNFILLQTWTKWQQKCILYI